MFATGLFDEPFVDEYAYITQSYYADMFLGGRRDDPAWLNFFAFDLQPVPKYLIGAGLRLARLPMPGPADAARWYRNTHTRFGDATTLTVARWPSLVLGALGCVALLVCGTMIGGRKTGAIAAGLLVLNPLYRLHAHRAMSEVPYEAFLIVGLCAALAAARRVYARGPSLGPWLLVALAGTAVGLSMLCKLNGLLGPIVMIGWSAAALPAPRLALGRKAALLGAAIAATAVAALVFVALNPAMTARPRSGPPFGAMVRPDASTIERFRTMVELRLETSRGQQRAFPDDALKTPGAKLAVFAIQGFGRFGPLGPSESNSRMRFEHRQDWGAMLWWPLILLGWAQAARLAVRQLRAHEPPTAAALMVWALLAWSVVALYVPMAWDRYLLPIQAPNALLGALAIGALWDRVRAPARAIWKRAHVPALGTFLVLLASYAFFWHSRDWNTASRLMLTYSLVDRGTVAIDGLEAQTGDKAALGGHFYSDKLPGYSFLAALPYAYTRWALDLPAHPLNGPALAYWPADYWIALATSGLLTAWTGALLVVLALGMGCSPRAAVLVGLSYGLATPAYVYATLAYGHQATAFALFGAFFLLTRRTAEHEIARVGLAGFLAAYAAVVELQVGPVSAVLGLYVFAQWMAGARPFRHLWAFAFGALVPALGLLGYNRAAFGSAWDMGYFHHATREFANVHNRDNPLGLMAPDWSKLGPLLWGQHRGLLFYAPILMLAAPGWFLLMARRLWELATVPLFVVLAVLLVNLSYPEWTGGWSTGPRLLVPLLPFAMVPVAAAVGVPGCWKRPALIAASVLALAGGALLLAFQGAGARVPPEIHEPLVRGVWPVWAWDGHSPLPSWRFHERFCRNLVSEGLPTWIGRLPARWRFVQFLPLVLGQILAVWPLGRAIAPRAGRADEPGIAGDAPKFRSETPPPDNANAHC